MILSACRSIKPMRLIALVSVATASLVGGDSLPEVTLSRLRSVYGAIQRVEGKVGVGPLILAKNTSTIRLVEYYGWGMRVITVSISNDAMERVDVGVARTMLGDPDRIERLSYVFLAREIERELSIIRGSSGYNTTERSLTPPVVDGSTCFVEVGDGLAYRWLVRDGFVGDEKNDIRDVLGAFSRLESCVDRAVARDHRPD
jgi:hypothetical protein